MTPPDVVTADISAPPGVVVVSENPALTIIDGVAKGGYPVDISAQTTVALTSSSESELGCGSDLIKSGPDAAAVAQFKDLDTQEAYRGEQDSPSSITEVIQLMEMAELVDILPTLSHIEEGSPSGPSVPSVMDMLESFGLGIGENSSFLDLEKSDLISGAGCQSQPNSSSVTETHSERSMFQGQDMSDTVCHTELSISGHDVTVLSSDRDAQQVSSKAVCLPARGQVEWDRPWNGSS